MKIGVILEGKNPPDKRVPFTPEQCKFIQDTYPSVDLVVQRSSIRAFKDEAYSSAGITLVEDLNDRDVIFGVKEVNKEDLLSDKIFFFFSHTIKEQPYNRDLLEAVIKKNIQLIDYECLTKSTGGRLVGFGRYAGIVGCYNSFLAYGKRTDTFTLKAANLCDDRNEMEGELPKIILPSNYKIALTGLGRVAGGAIEVLNKMGVKQVSPADYLTQEFTEAVFTQLAVNDYFRKPSGELFERKEVYNNPERFESDFLKFAAVSDMYIPCHYWDSNGPFIFTKEDMKHPDFKIRTIADISCDIDGPVPSTIRPSTIADPIYQYNIDSDSETTDINDRVITVMAVDNLPCELPKDASEDFGNELIKNILPSLIGEDSETIIHRASIAKDGDLTANYEYLRGYLNRE
jgi:alanine dehydrogenase